MDSRQATAQQQRPVPTQMQRPAGASVDPERTGETVTVACKLPHGLRLQLCDMITTTEASPQGYRDIKLAARRGKPFVIKGWARPAGAEPSAQMAGGYALTPGVPKDLWDEWLKQNHDHTAVENGLIFATGRTSDTAQEATKNVAILSGMEPINQREAPPEFRSGVRAVSAYKGD